MQRKEIMEDKTERGNLHESKRAFFFHEKKN